VALVPLSIRRPPVLLATPEALEPPALVRSAVSLEMVDPPDPATPPLPELSAPLDFPPDPEPDPPPAPLALSELDEQAPPNTKSMATTGR
jgi:hypothetical protein